MHSQWPQGWRESTCFEHVKGYHYVCIGIRDADAVEVKGTGDEPDAARERAIALAADVPPLRESDACTSNVHVWPNSIFVYGPDTGGNERCQCGAMRACDFGRETSVAATGEQPGPLPGDNPNPASPVAAAVLGMQDRVLDKLRSLADSRRDLSSDFDRGWVRALDNAVFEVWHDREHVGGPEPCKHIIADVTWLDSTTFECKCGATLRYTNGRIIENSVAATGEQPTTESRRPEGPPVQGEDTPASGVASVSLPPVAAAVPTLAGLAGPGRPPCEGFSASWCPNCGDCTCSLAVREAGEWCDDCPLHGRDSLHGMIDVVCELCGGSGRVAVETSVAATGKQDEGGESGNGSVHNVCPSGASTSPTAQSSPVAAAVLGELEREMMLHATNCGRDGRNHYCIDQHSDEVQVWRGLKARGLAEEGRPINDGLDAVFRVTAAGYDVLYPTEPPASEPTEGRSEPPRPLHLTWSGTEWVDSRCECRYHPDDDNMSHGGAPHVHLCERHAAVPRVPSTKTNDPCIGELTCPGPGRYYVTAAHTPPWGPVEVTRASDCSLLVDGEPIKHPPWRFVDWWEPTEPPASELAEDRPLPPEFHISEDGDIAVGDRPAEDFEAARRLCFAVHDAIAERATASLRAQLAQRTEERDAAVDNVNENADAWKAAHEILDDAGIENGLLVRRIETLVDILTLRIKERDEARRQKIRLIMPIWEIGREGSPCELIHRLATEQYGQTWADEHFPAEPVDTKITE